MKSFFMENQYKEIKPVERPSNGGSAEYILKNPKGCLDEKTLTLKKPYNKLIRTKKNNPSEIQNIWKRLSCLNKIF